MKKIFFYCLHYRKGMPDRQKNLVKNFILAIVFLSLFYIGKFMFEHRHEPLAPLSTFLKRFLQGFFLGMFLISFALVVGMLGYHYLEKLPWLDSFLSASMILSGMGPIQPLQHSGGKLFAAIYALFSGLIFVMVLGIIFAPVLHRAFHKFHLSK